MLGYRDMMGYGGMCWDMQGYGGICEGGVCTWLEALVHALQRFFVCPPWLFAKLTIGLWRKGNANGDWRVIRPDALMEDGLKQFWGGYHKLVLAAGVIQNVVGWIV